MITRFNRLAVCAPMLLVLLTALAPSGRAAQSASSVRLTSSANPVALNGSVTLTATVTPSGATGTITFRDTQYGSILGTATLSAGHATLATAALKPGLRSIIASYGGDASDAPSISAVFNQVVTPPAGGSRFKSAISTPFSRLSAIGMAMGDFNGDGKMDMALIQQNDFEANVTVLLGDGSGGFTLAEVISIVNGHRFPVAIAVGDLNGDGKLDLIIANALDASYLTVLLGNGAGGFTLTNPTLPAGVEADGVAVGDFNSDGKMDVALTSYFNNNVSVLLGDGAGGFTGRRTFPTGGGPTGISAGDFNNDGKADLLVGNQVSGSVTVLLGDGSGAFTKAAGHDFATGIGPIHLAVADFNGDGNLDVALVDNQNLPNLYVSVLLGDGSGAMNLAGGSPFSLGSTNGGANFYNNPIQSIAAGDFNGDGKMDLVITNPSFDQVDVVLGDGTGHFASAPGSPLFSGYAPTAVLVADFNGDGRVDVAVANWTSDNVATLLNDSTQTSVTGSPNPSVHGQTVTLTAAITPSAATGAVQFAIDGANFGPPVTVSGGTTVLSLSTLTAGSHTVTVNFSGSNGYGNSSGSLSVPQVVSVSSSTTSVASSQNPSVYGQPVTITATILPSLASGTVTFKDLDAGMVLGTATISGGIASLTVSSLQPGLRSIVAIYSGDSGDHASGSAYLYQQVTPNGSNRVVQPSGSPFATGNGPQAIAVGDFNGDGIQDLAIANKIANNLTVLLGTGSGGFTVASGSPVATGNSPYAIAVGDFDGDGKLDLAVANSGDSTVTVLLGIGAGKFSAAAGSPLAVGNGPRAIETGDFNGDGKLDLAIANFGASTVTVVLGTGSGTFAAASGSPFAVGSNPSGIAVGDFNRDGILDLAIANTGSSNVTELLGTGTGGFTAAVSPFAVGSGPQAIITGDFNGDGNLDLAIANTTDSTVTILLGVSSGGFTPASGSPFATGAGPQALATGDFNGDGILDLAVANPDGNNVTELLGNGSGGFAAASASPFVAGTKPIAIKVADFNGDGILDIAVANAGSNNVTILLGALTPTTTSVSSSLNPSPYSQAMAFTATVTPSTARGAVQFLIDGTTFGSPIALSGGIAVSGSTAALTAGSHTVTANLNGIVGFVNSTGTLSGGQVIIATSTTTSVAASPNPVTLGQPVIFTATIAPSSATGTVQFVVDGVNSGSPVSVSGGIAVSGAISTLIVGRHTVTANFAGVNYAGSTGSLIGNLSVALPVSVSVSTSLNPSGYGEAVTFTATVLPSDATGKIQFLVDGTNLGSPVPVIAGMAVSAPTSALAVGNHAVTTNFVPDTLNYALGSGTLVGGQKVGATATTVSSSGTPVVAGGSVTLTATVAGMHASNIPTGTVTFRDLGLSLPLGTIALTGGTASLTTSSLKPGLRSLVAIYSGDATNSGSGSATFLQAITPNGSGRFTAATGSPVAAGSNPAGVATADFNGDGIPDLVVANRFSNNISVFLGDSSGGYTNVHGTLFATGTNPVNIVAGDFNGDGAMDLAVTNALSKSVTVLLGNGAGAFTEVTGSPFVIGTTPRGIVMGDFNGDGKLDLAISNSGDATVTVLLGDGAGGFTASPGSPYAVGTLPFGIATGDFNGDGKLDLAVVNRTSQNVTVLLGDGSGRFSQVTGSPFAVGTSPFGIAVGDFDGNGTLDLAVSNSGSASVTLLLGSGMGSFTPASNSPFAVGNSPYGLVAGDFDGDGKLDLAVANDADKSVTVLRGTGTGSFTVATGSPLATGAGPLGITTGDFNGDGILDLAVIGSTDNTMTVLLGSATSTTITVSSLRNPVSYGQSVAFTAAVAPSAATGTVQFAVDAISLGSPVTVTSGIAVSGLTSPVLSAGNHTVTASFMGTGGFTRSSASLQGGLVVNAISTSITVSSSPSPSTFGQPLTFTGVITPSAATGMVQFVVDGANLGSPVPVSGGTASSSAISTLAVGPHLLSAVYSGDSGNTPSTSNTITISVAAAQVSVPNVVGQTQAAATTAITGAGLTIGAFTTAASNTVTAGNVISTSPVAATLVNPGSAVALVISTGPTQVAVPNVVGQPQAPATTAITGAGLVVGTVTTASSSTVTAGSVISTNPVAATQVNLGAAVSLVISTGPAQVAVPNVVGQTQAGATTAITGAGLVVGTVTSASSSTVTAGSVISTNPTAATQVNQGSAVNLLVSTGPAQVAVPDVVGQAQAAATTSITGAGLIVGTVSTASSSTVTAGNVISTNPAAATRVNLGSVVSVVVSTGPLQVTAPDVTGQVTITRGAAIFSRVTGRYTQSITLSNSGAALPATAFVLDNLATGYALYQPSGFTSAAAPASSPFQEIGVVGAGANVTFTLELTRTGTPALTYTPRILGPGAR